MNANTTTNHNHMAQQIAHKLAFIFGVPAIKETSRGLYYLTHTQPGGKGNGPVFTYTRFDKIGA